jgi:hypothetical protein
MRFLFAAVQEDDFFRDKMDNKREKEERKILGDRWIWFQSTFKAIFGGRAFSRE